MTQPSNQEAPHPSPTGERVPLTSEELIEGRKPDQLGTHGGPAHTGKKPADKPTPPAQNPDK